MAIDTVRLKSPYIDDSLLRRIEAKCVLRQGIEVESGEVLYEITSGSLLGSWDSRISIKPMREDFVMSSSGRPVLHPSEPYFILECSAHKVFHGHNIYGGPVDFQETCLALVEFLENLLDVELPPARNWLVRRVDWAENYRLLYVAIQEFFEGLHTVQFPRRRAAKFGAHSIHFPGSTTTVKMYHKGLEFREHDFKRLKYFFSLYRAYTNPSAQDAEANSRWVNRKLEAFQRLANNRLRVEVGIHAEKLDFDFGHQPYVHEVTSDYLKGVHDREVGRLMKEGKSPMEIVRDNRSVSNRLRFVYGETRGSQLLGFWFQMAGLGEEVARQNFSRTVFYRNRKALQDAGVSWLHSNVHVIANQSALPADFKPFRSDPRLCQRPARNRPAIYLDRDFLKLAA
jgi:II/X family phage/plasmid replication protein